MQGDSTSRNECNQRVLIVIRQNYVQRTRNIRRSDSIFSFFYRNAEATWKLDVKTSKLIFPCRHQEMCREKKESSIEEYRTTFKTINETRISFCLFAFATKGENSN